MADSRYVITALTEGGFEGLERSPFRGWTPTSFRAGWPLFIVRQAWDRGLDLEDLADGYGPGLGTMGGDWSGIRDSSEPALRAMVEAALNFLFPAPPQVKGPTSALVSVNGGPAREVKLG